MLAYLWNNHGIYPGDVYNRPYAERLFIYAATGIRMDAEAEEAKELDKARRKGK